MKLILKIAEKSEIKSIQDFFEEHLDIENPGIINEEFLCPFGIEGAINRKQIVILKDKYKIVGALRFYPRKRDNIVSIYQFALDNNLRGKGLVNKMIKKIGYEIFESLCFINSEFNKYYKKAGWKLEKSDIKFNYWNLKIK